MGLLAPRGGGGGRSGEVHARFLVGKVEGRDRFEDLCINESIILKWMNMK